MKRIFAVIGGSLASSLCFHGAWQLAQNELKTWWYFLVVGFLIQFLTLGVALSEERVVYDDFDDDDA